MEIKTPFNLDEVESVHYVESKSGYCDICVEKNLLTPIVEMFSGKMFMSCEDCGRKMQWLMWRRENR